MILFISFAPPERDRRNECHPSTHGCDCDSALKNIRLDPTPLDERLPIIDYILGQLILDRCGPYAFVRRVRSTGQVRDAVPTEVNLDLMPQPFPIPIGSTIFTDLSPSDARHDCVTSFTGHLERLAYLTPGAFGVIPSISPTTSGRGSPDPRADPETRSARAGPQSGQEKIARCEASGYTGKYVRGVWSPL